ncbi:acetolactate synthase small subunit [Aggregatilinea lenta]|uniref:acetolactate synthase small subunit n=1 Tax=Aggregatilinea lenta TaxID=913108 RepID=UPI000E5A7F1C|nr:acetolactate synthase small subunit [Aggregatilinea lenta]
MTNGNANDKQTLVALVENRPGVLNRVASLFRRRNFNIDSLTVGRTENPEISRMTIVVDHDAEKVGNQLSKLVNVIEVQEVTDVPNVSRDLALIKVAVESSQARGEIVQLCDIFRAHIVDAGPDAMIIEITGDEQKISSMVELLRPLGIKELVRTGVVTMTRGDHVLAPDEFQMRSVKRTNGHRASVV